MWIGLLWYLNFVQIPNMPNIPDEQKPAFQSDRAGGAVLVPLGGDGHCGSPACCWRISTAICWRRSCWAPMVSPNTSVSACAGRDHVVQRVVCDLANQKRALGLVDAVDDVAAWPAGRCSSRESTRCYRSRCSTPWYRRKISTEPSSPTPPVNARLNFNARTAPMVASAITALVAPPKHLSQAALG